MHTDYPLLRTMKIIDSRRFARGLGLGLLGLVLVAGLAACKPGGAATAAEEPHFRLATVQSGNFRVSVSATGKVKPKREVDVLSKAGGEIIELPFDLGNQVTKGALVAKIDPVNEQRNVDRSEAQLQSAKARLEKARNELTLSKSGNRMTTKDAGSSVKIAEAKLAEAESKFKRQQGLYERKLVPKDTLETFATQLEQARTDLERARANSENTASLPVQEATRVQDIKLAEVDVLNADIALADARKLLEDTTVVAPMDGIVTERKVELGQVISSPFNNVSGGTKIMVVSDLSVLYLVTAVDESDIGGIKVGQKASITADAYPNEQFEGTVAHIAPTGTTLNSVVTFDVKVEVKGEGLKKLRPGMTANVVIILGESPNTCWVQTEAVQKNPDGSTYVEVTQTLGEPVKVPVTVGLSDGLRTEVKGVEGGKEVVLRERTGLTAWERGEGVERPMKAGFNPFKKKTTPTPKPAEKKEERPAAPAPAKGRD